MASCQVCEKPLCAVCVYFDKGIAYCQEHLPVQGSGTVEFKAARQADAGEQPETLAAPNPPDEGGETVAIAPPIGGNPVLPPQPAQQPLQQPLPGWAPPAPTVIAPPPHWSQDPRLTPMPLEWRPGWTDDPLIAPASNGVDSLATGGLVTSSVALVFSFCCGFGAPIGLLISLVGGGLSVGALVNASRARDPNKTRTLAGIGLGIAVLGVALAACVSFVLIGGGMFDLFP